MPKTLFGLSVLAALALVLGGCASRTPVSGKYPPITPHAAQSGQYTGTTVRWGGVLIETTPQSGRTCFRVMGLPLAGDGRPQGETGERQTGRFIACAHGFYDPVLYAAGRRITFVGTITGVKQEAVGGYQYPYPELAAQIVYLWPKEAPSSGTVPYYGPYYWGPWGPWGADWWWSPWGYWPPAYLHDHDRDHRRSPPPPPPPAGGGGQPPPPAAPRPLRPGIKVQPSPSFHPGPSPSRPPPSRPSTQPSAPPSRPPPPHPGSGQPSPPPSPSQPAPSRPNSSQPPARPSPPTGPSSPPPSRPDSRPVHRPSPHAHPAPPRTRLRAAMFRRRAGDRAGAAGPELA